MIDFGRNDNREFNDLAEKLVTKVLRTKFKAAVPDNPEHFYTLANIKTMQPDNSAQTYSRKKLVGGKLTIKVYGDIVESDEKGRKIQTVETKVLLGSIPYRTRVGTYLIGNDYNLTSQPRNIPSVYSTVSEGGKIQSSFQLAKGHSFKITISDAGSLRIKSGDKVFHLIPMLMVMGMTGNEIRKIIGDKLYDHNKKLNWPVFYTAVNETFFYNDPEFINMSEDDKNKQIQNYMENNTKLDGDMTLMLTGIYADKVTKDLFAKVLERIVALYRKEDIGDDRWDLRTSKIMTPSHMFADRLDKQLPRILAKNTNKIRRGDLRTAFTNIITKPMEDTVKISDLSRMDPQYNLIGTLLTGKVITPVGEGAISDTGLVENRGRQYHPTQTGILDMTFTPQGMGVGINLRIAPGLVVDDDGTPSLKLKNIKTGKVKAYTLNAVTDLYIKFPGEPDSGNIKAFHDYKEVEIPYSKATHEFAESVFADSMQLVPFPTGMQGPRGIMAATQFAQAVPLVNREASRVTAKGKVKSTNEELGQEYLDRLGLTAPLSGEVVSVDKNRIKIKSEGGQERVIKTDEVIPLQYNTGIKISPKKGLKPGDKVRKGEPLFITNMHDEKGLLAPGIHLKTMWAVDSEGYGAEDGIVISESAATKKLVSEHFYKIEVNPNPGEEISYHKIKTLYKHKYSPEQFGGIDPDTGIIKKGVKVKTGDLLACLISKREAGDMDVVLGRLSRSLGTETMDTSLVWDKFHDGEIISVTTEGRKTIIVIETREVAEVVTKLTGRYGNKGVISKILPDELMPIDTDTNERIDIILSPLGVPSRTNVAQISEASLGATGKTYVVEQFKTDRSISGMAEKELVKAGKRPDGKANVFNPATGVTNEVGVGEGYFLKLFSPEKSISARGLTGGFDSNMQPVKGGKTGSKGLGLMEFYALLGHNSKNLLKEFGTIKGEKNLDFWRNYELGLANMPKSTPFTFGKFNAIMTAAGAQISRTPEGIALTPVTDRYTENLAEGRTIREAGTYRGTNLEEIKGGLFDPGLTGGKRGNLWSEYELSEGVPHPMLSSILRTILNIPKKEWDDYIVDNSGEELKQNLENLDVTVVEERLRTQIENKKDLTNSTQALRFLLNMKKLKGTKLSDFIIKKIPVIPPKYRPLTVMPDGTRTVNDLNYLYQDIITSDKLLKSSKGLPKTEKEARKNMVQAVNAFVGLTEPRSQALKDKGVKGALTYITGRSSPKEGFFLSKMMKKQMISTGRARIIPDPTANMDEVGIPKYIAWTDYEPHLRAELRKTGYKPDQITVMIKNRDPIAERALQKVLKENYILVNRAPTLHSFGILAGKPKLVGGNYISIPTTFEAPLNADYDGDEVTLHAPITAKGKEDAEKMLLSNNPFSGYSPFDLVTNLDYEPIIGLFLKSEQDPKELKKWWAEHMPEDIELNFPFDKAETKKVLRALGKKYPGEKYAELVSELNRQGFKWASELGVTMTLGDIKPLPERKLLIKEYISKIKNVKGEKEKNKLMGEFQTKVLDMVVNAKKRPNFYNILKSKARGNPVQISSIIATPAVFTDPRTHETSIIEGNISDGYSFSEHLKMNAKARNEMIQTKMSVAGPGDLYKQMAFNTRQAAITEEDCGTDNGIEVIPASNDFNSDDLIGRLLSKKQGTYKKDTIITPDNLSDFLGFTKIYVRSPITCETDRGLCAKCYGVDDNGELLPIGEHVNVKAINSFSMAIFQKGMDAKHSIRTFSGEAERKTLFEETKDLLTGSDTKISAPVSTVSGIVRRLDENEDRSWTMWIDDAKVKIPYPLTPKQKKGDRIEIGDILADGAQVNTKEIGNTLGHGYARKLFTDAMHNQIFIPAGITPHQRNVELLAKELYKYAEVKKDTGGHITGDIITLQEAIPLIQEYSVELPVDKVKEGMRLADNIGGYLALDMVSKPMLITFKDQSITRIKVVTDPERIVPIAKGMSSLPLLDGRDWLDNMGFRFLKRNITQAMSSGHVQKIDPTTAPLTSYVTNIWD